MFFYWIYTLCVGFSWAHDPNKPHPHPASLQSITKAPEPVALSMKELKRLERGDVVLRTIKSTDSEKGRGVAIQYIDAPADVVWQHVLDYARYPKRVNNVIRGEVYQKEDNRLYVALISKVLFIEFGVYTINTLHKDQNYMSWVLDRSRTSDAEDLIGYWRIVEISQDHPRTRVDFSSEVQVSGVPDFIEKYLREDSLRNGTGWVKRYSEKSLQQKSR